MASVGARTYTWSADHTAPVGIAEGALSTTFLYGPGGEKRYQCSSDGTTSASRWFAGEGYELDVSGGVTTTRIYLGDFAVRETSGGVTTTRYTLRDHLGSVEVVLDGDATDGASIYDSVIAYQSFAPFGSRRDADWAGAYTDTPPLDEGYTGHQMLDAFNLIHMNGRVYDPTVGRFLSPDILIQAPYFSQSYNRYSYVMNGPMMFVDPSGYLSELGQAELSGHWYNAPNFNIALDPSLNGFFESIQSNSPTSIGMYERITLVTDLVHIAAGIYDEEFEAQGNFTRVSAGALGLPSEGLINPETGFKSGAFYSRDFNLLVGAMAGTEPDIGDIEANILQGSGFIGSQYQQAMNNGFQFAAWAEAKNTGLIFTGHSLGGGLAIAAGLVTAHHVLAFNPAGVHRDTVGHHAYYQNQAYINSIIVRGDGLDMAQHGRLLAPGGLIWQAMPDVVGNRIYVDSPLGASNPLQSHSISTVCAALGTGC